ncbi:cytochrome P450/oxidoreductase [Microbacterium sp. SSM24]|uniref:cytochrome P450/oxidoreductase n=1 Tax=Microbacterium sp. SSM24 TaxID=2991714 RepID=UPI002226767E|nr:cytochrome P450/oxidoreductase [Microbacterium sp. SSM24]MCW3492628.1 cytochrome P450/oxidoreductase [Microbacterium sp. SSM24]
MGSPGGAPSLCPVTGAAAAFDPFSPDYLNDPAGSLRWSRDDEPVFFSPEIGYWVVTRYDDVKEVFRDNVTFSPSIALEKITATSREAEEVLESYGYAMSRTLVNEDEPAHMPRRRALMESFIPAELAHHEDMVRRITREYVDRFVDSGRADLVDQMLWEVPLTVALHFLGVPEDDMPRLRRYSVAHTVNTWGRPAPEQQVAVAEAVGGFWQLSGEIVDKIRVDPEGPGWMRYSIRQNALMPDVVTDSYVHSIMMAGIVAAHETTANASANAIRVLLENREAWDDICRDPSLIPNAVEECLRHSGSIVAWRRKATVATTIGGVPIPADAKLLIVQASANHDDRHFDHPDTLDIRRPNAGDHLSFGFGSHQCMGKNLARMEMQIFLEELTTRLPHLRIAEQEFTYLPNTSFRGPEHLWVEWDPEANPERTDPRIRDRRFELQIGVPSSRLLSHRLTVADRAEVAAGVVALTLVPAPGSRLPAWSPGAHIDLECGELSRQYSLCGDPEDRESLRVAVRMEEKSRGGSRWVHSQLKAGDQVVVRGPRNHFRLDPSAGSYIFVAGGIGITPVMALAREARRLGKYYRILYAGRSRQTMPFVGELLEEHPGRVHLYIGDEGTRMPVEELFGTTHPGTQVYACGPQRLLSALEDAMAAWPQGSLHSEHFASAGTLLDPDNEHEFEIELVDSNQTLLVPRDRTVLQVLREANIDVQSDCEEGLCGACEVRVVAGTVDHRDVVLSHAEKADGRTMMTCCSRAFGERISLSL